jgi:hypothetical protein
MGNNGQSELEYEVKLPGVEERLIRFEKFVSEKKMIFPREEKETSKFNCLLIK